MTLSSKNGPARPGAMLSKEALEEWWREQKDAPGHKWWIEMAAMAAESLRLGVAEWGRRYPASVAYTGIVSFAEERQDPGHELQDLARAAIQREHKDEATDAAVDRLARELLGRTRSAAVALGIAAWEQAVTPDSPEGPHLNYEELEDLSREHAGAGEDKPADGMLPLTARAAAVLTNIGERGGREAKRLREDARRRWAARGEEPAGIWRPWCGPKVGGPFRFWLQLALAVWSDVVRPQLELEARLLPAVGIGTARALLDLGDRNGQLVTHPGRAVIRRGNSGVVVGAMSHESSEWLLTKATERHLLPGADRAALCEIQGWAQKQLQSLMAKRFRRWIVHKAYSTWLAQGCPPTARTWHFPVVGGWQQIIKELGLASGKNVMKLERAAYAHQAVDLDSPAHGFRDCWLFKIEQRKEAAPGQSARLLFTVNWPFLSWRVKREGSTLASADRLLVPAPEVAPTFVGRGSWDRAKEWDLQDRVMIHLADRSIDLATLPGIKMSGEDWERIADESGIGPQTLPRIIKAYQESLFPVLEDIGDGLVRPKAERMLLFLQEQAKLRKGKHRKGKRSGQARRGSRGKK